MIYFDAESIPCTIDSGAQKIGFTVVTCRKFSTRIRGYEKN
jgi:hypothetical protein